MLPTTCERHHPDVPEKETDPGGGGPGVDAHPDPQSLVGAVGKQDPRGDQHQVDGKVGDLDSKYIMYSKYSMYGSATTGVMEKNNNNRAIRVCRSLTLLLLR